MFTPGRRYEDQSPQGLCFDVQWQDFLLLADNVDVITARPTWVGYLYLLDERTATVEQCTRIFRYLASIIHAWDRNKSNASYFIVCSC